MSEVPGFLGTQEIVMKEGGRSLAGEHSGNSDWSNWKLLYFVFHPKLSKFFHENWLIVRPVTDSVKTSYILCNIWSSESDWAQHVLETEYWNGSVSGGLWSALSGL